MRASPQKLLCVLCVINMFLILKNIIYNIYIIFYNTHTHNIFSLSLPIADIHIIRTKTLLFISLFLLFYFLFYKTLENYRKKQTHHHVDIIYQFTSTQVHTKKAYTHIF